LPYHGGQTIAHQLFAPFSSPQHFKVENLGPLLRHPFVNPLSWEFAPVCKLKPFSFTQTLFPPLPFFPNSAGGATPRKIKGFHTNFFAFFSFFGFPSLFFRHSELGRSGGPVPSTSFGGSFASFFYPPSQFFNTLLGFGFLGPELVIPLNLLLKTNVFNFTVGGTGEPSLTRLHLFTLQWLPSFFYFPRGSPYVCFLFVGTPPPDPPPHPTPLYLLQRGTLAVLGPGSHPLLFTAPVEGNFCYPPTHHKCRSMVVPPKSLLGDNKKKRLILAFLSHFLAFLPLVFTA